MTTMSKAENEEVDREESRLSSVTAYQISRLNSKASPTASSDASLQND
jgi:hypothetical protein